MRTVALFSVILPAVLCGCSDTQLRVTYEEPVLSEQPNALGPTQWVDEFQQRTVAESDILFVVDDSCSMEEEQEELADNFDGFISNFVATNLDYHIGVTRASLHSEGGLLSPPNPELDWGVLEAFDAGDPWIDAGTADIVSVFNDIANVGTGGGDCEMALQASFSALNARLQPGQPNVGFYREDAILTLVLLSDENDHGVDGGPFPCGGIGPSEYTNWLLSLKGWGNEDMVSFTVISGGDDGCTANGNEADPAPNYMEVVDAVGGNFLSICDNDWSTFLTELGLEAAGLKRAFQLRRIPVESSLAVTVDGSDPGPEAWTYDRVRNSIDFPLEHVPAELAVVRVEYILQEDVGATAPE